MPGCPFQPFFFCWSDSGLLHCPLCAVGLWGGGVEETAGSGHICIALCSCCGTPCLPPARGISHSRFASCAALCISSSSSRWNPSHHFWSYLQMPLSLCWAWTQCRLSIPCSVLEASLSPIPLPLSISLMFCFWTDLYPSESLSDGPPCTCCSPQPFLLPPLPLLSSFSESTFICFVLLGLCWWFVWTMKVISLQNVLRFLHAFPCLEMLIKIHLQFILNVRIIL